MLVLLILAVVGYLGYQYMNGGGLIAPSITKIENIRFTNVKLPPNLGITFDSDMVLTNPNAFSMTIDRMEFDVFVNGKRSNKVEQSTDVKVPANADFTLPLEFDIPLKNNELFKDLKGIFSGAWKKQAIDIKTEGTIYVKALGTSIGVPFEYEDNYKLQDYLK